MQQSQPEQKSKETFCAQTHTQSGNSRDVRADATGVQVRTASGIEFYRSYLYFLAPLHKMGKSDTNILAHILLRREQIAAECKNPDMVDEILFSNDERRNICQMVGCTRQRFRQSMLNLKKCKAITGNRLDKRIIPRFIRNNGEYLLLIHFCIDGGDKH